jgi:hypothetical protein
MPRGAFAGALGAGAGASAMVWLPSAVGAALGFWRARGGSVWRLPLLCVRSDVSRRAASWTRGGGCAFGSLCCARGPLSIIVRAPRGGVVGRRRRRALPSVVGDWDVCGAGWGRFGGLGDNFGKLAVWTAR